MKNPFKRKLTKWIPLGKFCHGVTEHVTFARKNLKTGMIYFKTKQVNGWFGAGICTTPFMPHDIIDTQKAWDELNDAKSN